MKHMMKPALILALLLGVGACDGESNPLAPSGDVPAKVELVSAATVAVESLGEVIRIEARALDGGGREVDVPLAYRAETPGVLEALSTVGEFRSVGKGRTRVTVSVRGDGGEALRAHVAVEVDPLPVSLTIGPGAPLLASDGVVRLWALGQETILPVWSADANGYPVVPMEADLAWSSEDAGVSSVDYAGRVEAVSDGTTTLHVTGGGLSGEIRVEVDASLQLQACASAEGLDAGGCGGRGLTFVHGSPPDSSR